MPFQTAPGTIGVVIEGRLFGEMYNNTLYFFQNGADPTVGDCSAVATLVSNWFQANLLPILCNDLVMLRVTAKNLVVNGGAKAVISMSGAAGEVETEAAPNNVAAVVTYDTGQSGKSSHGRNYLGAVPNAEITINTISATFAAAVIAAYQELLPGGGSDPTPYSWAILSRVSAGVTLAAAVAVPVLNVYFTDTTVDSQRRRLPGRGR